MKPWARSPTLHKPGLVVDTCNPSSREVEAGGPEIQGQLHGKLQASLLYETISKQNKTKSKGAKYPADV